MGANQSANNAETGILSGLTPDLQAEVSSWLTTYGPALQGILGTQTGEQQQYAADTAGVAKTLSNFVPLTPAEISALTLQAGNAVKSASSTMRSQTGALANPNLVAKELADTAGQTAAGVATNLGSIASQEKLGATEAAGGLYSGLNTASLQAMLQSLGIGAGVAQSGSQGLQGAASLYGQQQQQSNQAKSGLDQGIFSLLGSAGSLAGMGFGGGGGGSAVQYGTPTPPTLSGVPTPPPYG